MFSIIIYKHKFIGLRNFHYIKIQKYHSLNTEDFIQQQNVEFKISPKNKFKTINEKKENEELINENQLLKQENESLKNENKKLKKELNNYNFIKDKYNKIKEEYKKLNAEKDKIISELKAKLNNNVVEQNNYNNYNLLEGEKLVAVNFISVDQRINHTIICKNKTAFHDIEGQLYKKFPEYSDNENYFIFNGNRIKRFKTLEENNILGYTVILQKIED